VSTERLVRMANQIAASVPDRDRAAEETAAHIRSFWAPSMIDDLLVEAHRYADRLSPVASEALTILQREPVTGS
jgi:hypothetical protein